MAAVGGTPADYGLRVRSHPTLLVTSPVKMRNGVELQLSFAGDISRDDGFRPSSGGAGAQPGHHGQVPRKARTEAKVGRNPAQRIGGVEAVAYVWQEVPGEAVAAFLAQLQVPEAATQGTMASLLAEFIQKQLSGMS